MNITTVPFHELDEEALRLVLRWRNDKRIRQWMENQNPVSFDEHLKFVQNLSKTEDRFYFLVYRENHPIGVINLTSIDYSRGEAELGIYRRPDEESKGHGTVLLSSLEQQAIRLGLVSLFLKVRRNNDAAFRLYEKNGYRVTDTDEKYTYMKKRIV